MMSVHLGAVTALLLLMGVVASVGVHQFCPECRDGVVKDELARWRERL